MDEEGKFNNLFHFGCMLGYTYNVWCLSSTVYTKDVRHTVVSLCLKVYFIIEKWWSTISTDVRQSRAVWNVIWNVLFSWMRMSLEGYFTTRGDINLPWKYVLDKNILTRRSNVQPCQKQLIRSRAGEAVVVFGKLYLLDSFHCWLYMLF